MIEDPICCSSSNTKLFCKIKQKKFRNSSPKPYWTVEERNPQYGFIYRNFNGGFITRDLIDIVECCLTTESVEDFIDEHRTEIYEELIDENSKLGWLSPDCVFYGCSYTKHSEVADLYLGKSEIQLEKDGWIKVFREFDSDRPVYAQITMNEKQLKWLFDNGVKYSKFASYQDTYDGGNCNKSEIENLKK